MPVRGVPLGAALVAAGLYLIGLGSAPFLDPPEGFHAVVARTMVDTRDWIAPRINGVRYFDKPPLMYWLMAAGFAVDGLTPFTARLWSALAAVGCAAVTARIGVLLGGPRLGLLAGLMVVTNLGIFVFGRQVKPDLLFILCLVLAWAGFALAYRGAGRWALALFYGALGLATLSKDFLGAVGPLAVVALFFWLTRERPLGPWTPWWGVLLLAAVALPWYLLVEHRNPGFLWYTVVDNTLLNAARSRVFPDEDVPLGSIAFVLVTAAAFLPWTLALPWSLARALRRPWTDVTDRLWLVFGLWSVAVIGVFTLSPFKLPHYGLPAFPALALLAARAWSDAIDRRPGAARPRALIVPVLGLFAALAVAMALGWAGVLSLPEDALTAVDLTTRNLAAEGHALPPGPGAALTTTLGRGAVVLALGAVALAVAAWRPAPALGVAAALATMVAFLPVAAEGMSTFARSRSAAPVVEALAAHVQPGDLVVVEGALENIGSLLLVVDGPIRVVDGLRSNLAFGATFPEARDLFWDPPRLATAWKEPGRHFLVSGVAPERSVVRALPADAVRVIARGGGRWLYGSVGE